MDPNAFFIIVVGTTLGWIACRGLERSQRRDVMLALGVHVFAAFVHWGTLEFYYGRSGDAYRYQREGASLARLLDADFAYYAPEVAKLALHFDARLPFEVLGEGANTGTMSAIAALWIFVGASSMLSLCLTVSFLAWFGQLCMYHVAREELELQDLVVARVGFLFVPSVLFWGAGFTKEAYVLSFLGVLCVSLHRLVVRRSLPYVFGVLVGAVGVGLIKAFTLVPFTVAAGVYMYAARAWRGSGRLRFRPGYLLLAGILAVGGVLAVGRFFPELAGGSLAETVSRQQEGWGGVQGGSDIAQLGGEGRSLGQQVQFVPLALLNILFRPSIFDVKNSLMLMAAVEDTVLLWAVLSMLRRGSRSHLLDEAMRTPLIVFCATFVAIFGIGVGLVTSNLGSLSRYRMPMMPFYVALVLILRRRVSQVAVRDAPSRLALQVPRRVPTRLPASSTASH